MGSYQGGPTGAQLETPQTMNQHAVRPTLTARPRRRLKRKGEILNEYGEPNWDRVPTYIVRQRVAQRLEIRRLWVEEGWTLGKIADCYPFVLHAYARLGLGPDNSRG